MASGGKRTGSGRPRGAASKRSREIADQAAKDGITPLEVMIQNMRRWHKAKRYELAQGAAKDAAPYMHPRLQTMTVQGDPTAPLTIQVVTGIPLPVEKKPTS